MRRWVTGLVALTLAACGSGGSDLSGGASRNLSDQVEVVAQAAEACDVDGARAALDQLRIQVDLLQDGGEVSGSRARRIRDAADSVGTHLDECRAAPAPTSTTSEPASSTEPESTTTTTTTPTTTTTTSTTTTTTAPAPDQEGDDDGPRGREPGPDPGRGDNGDDD